MPAAAPVTAALAPAPFHAAAPPGLPAPRAVWARAADGVRLRLVLFPPPEGGRGWLLVFPGRSEWAEKYVLAAAEFGRRGWGLLVPDWRGQALSDRLHPDPRAGHVGRFADYQRDVATLLAAAREAGLGPPAGLVAHSMGGAIGLRALAGGLSVPAVVFSAPMWGLALTTYLRPAIRLGVALLDRRRRAAGPSGTPAGVSYIADAPFAGNLLTSDPEVFAALQAEVRAHPELALAGPTLHWLAEAVREMRRLAALPPPPLPMLAVLGSEEAVIDPTAVRARVRRWPGARLLILAGARHEPMMEAPAIRAAFYDAAAAHLAAHAPAG